MKNTFIIIILSIILIAAGPLMAARKKQITITGSTTVLPIAQAAAEAFMDINDVNISVRGGGSGVGVAALINKTASIANSSRPMKAKEITQAKSAGVNPVVYAVANDGITIVVNQANSIKDISIKQIKDIYTGKVTNWSQVGGPNMPVVIISRDVASGTFEVFNEKVLSGSKVIDSAMMLASNNAVATTVGDTPGAIGYIGLGYVTDKTKIVTVEGITPSVKTIKSGEYKISRKLYMYTNGKATGDTAKFLNFIFSPAGQKIVEEQGFISVK